MPLTDITNSQDLESANRKRSHGDFLKQEAGESGCLFVPSPVNGESPGNKENKATADDERAGCSPSPSLTASGSSPLDGNSPSPNVTPKRAPDLPLRDAASLSQAQSLPATKPAHKSTGERPAKRKRLTPEEKAAKARADELDKQERKAKKEKEKAEREAEREAERRAKAEQRLKEAERKKQEKAQKDAEKTAQTKEPAKKPSNQRKLTEMFKIPPSTPKREQAVIKTEKADDAGMAGSPPTSAAKSRSLYEQTFKPFFVKENVKLAGYPYEMDEEMREVKSKILSEYVEGKREMAAVPMRENALDVLQIPFRCRRGRVYPSVRKIMAEYHGNASSIPIDLTTESHNTQIRHTLEALKIVPVKSLKFKEDVRPPYVGTISGLPPGVKSLRKIARQPTARTIPSLNYDYDSEAEWQEEDGEDVEDLDDEDDDADNDEDMDDFLDDSEDAGPSRLVFSGGMEPESTGLCWETRKRFNSPAKVFKFRMEFMLESLDHHYEIDPFSDSYWNPAGSNETLIASVSAAGPNPSLPSSALNSTLSPRTASKAAPTTSDAFQALAQGPGAAKKALQPLPSDVQEELKKLVREMPTLSKLGLVEVFSSRYPSFPKAQIKLSFELLTETVREGRKKKWKLKDEA